MIRTLARLTGILGLSLVLAGGHPYSAARAAIVVDQSQPIVSPTGSINRLSTGPRHYSFQQAADNIAGASLLVRTFGEVGDVSIFLYDDNPSASGSLLASGTVTGVGTVGVHEDVWVDVFWNAIGVVPDTDLYLDWFGTAANQSITGIHSNPYSRGMYWGGTTPDTKGIDIGFRTYSDTSFGAVSEPAGFLILGLGFAALGFARRQRAA